MGDLISSASAWLGQVMADSLAAPVTYRRGGAEGITCPWTATIGATSAEAQDAGGMTIEVQVRDYIGPVAPLIAGGIDMPPRTGDQIVEADGTVYELMAIPREGHWRWSDRQRLRLRLHTKQVAA
jgi:hypothetical protein